MKKYSPYSELKMFYHTDRIAGMLEGKRVAPVYIRLKPTNICNQRCFYCAYANYTDTQLFDERRVDKRESIPWDIMEELIDDFVSIGVKGITLSGGGEPLCYPYIEELLLKIKESQIDYSLITNAQALAGENILGILKDAKWVRVSLDSANKETYEGIRGVKTLPKVIDNIANFSQIKNKNLILGVNCVVSQDNSREIFDICKMVKEAGVDNIKISPILINHGMEEYHRIIKEDVIEQIKRAKSQLEAENFRIVDKYTADMGIVDEFTKPYERCYIQELFAVIGADCKVYRCHQRAYMSEGEIGDISKRRFKDLWFDEDTTKLVREYNPSQKCKFRCAFDERNIILWDFMNIDRNHINFV